jgi:hypothetical protein
MKSLAMICGVLAVTASVAAAQGDAATGGGASAQDDVQVLAQAALHANAGQHAQAIAIYEQVYARTGDEELLPVLGVEYRRAGAQLDAMQHFCTYLTLVPRGEQAWFSTSQVISIRRELGETIDARNVCAPIVPRVDFAPTRPAKKPMSMRHRAAIASAVIGAASIGAAIHFNFEAQSISDQITSHPSDVAWSADIKELERSGARSERNAMVFAAVGGAAFVTAGVLWLTGRERGDAVFAPTVSSSGGGVTLSRGF